jgi:hypothetical protein
MHATAVSLVLCWQCMLVCGCLPSNVMGPHVLQARDKWDGKFYQVHPSDAALTMPEEPQLATDARAMEREEFDSHIKEKWQQIEVRTRTG